MQFLVFALTYPFIWLFSRLPMRILYIKSDIFFFLIYYVVGYRKKVVLENLKLAFPEKSEEERIKISKKFFKHLMDLFMESIKAFSISEKEILKRYRFKNPEHLNTYIKSGKSIAIVGSHHGNWEWSFCLPLLFNCKFNGAYTSLDNSYFDKIVKESREKFGFNCYKSANTVKEIYKDYAKKTQGVYFLLSDQSPQLEHTFYWKTFFNVKVPVHTGAETLAKKFDFVVINMSVKKLKRGYYETEFQLISDSPKEEPKHSITDKYHTLTEDNVSVQPECYLWSHNRFKHQHNYEEWKKSKSLISKKKK